MRRPQKDPTPSSSFTPYGRGGSSDPLLAAALGSPPPSARRPPPRLSRLWRFVLLSGACFALTGLVALGLWLDELQVFEVDEARLATIVHQKPLDNSLVFDREGQKIGEFFNQYQVYVPYEKIPKDMIQAILAIEDRNFWNHRGFDPKGMLRAAFQQLRGKGSRQGASTLTQQIVRNFLLPRERTLQRKVQEVALAIQLEQRLSKERLLEIYANNLFLGNGSYGVGAAAYRYFGRSIDQLGTHEMALIAGLFQSPSRFNPVRYPKRAKARQNLVLKAMYQQGMLTKSTYRELRRRKLDYKEYRPIHDQVAPYFVDYVHEEARRLLGQQKQAIDGQGLRIYTTLDARLQRQAEESLVESSKLLDTAQERTAQVKDKDGNLVKATLEAAILSVDPRTGQVVAMVGGRDYARSKFNRTHQALRSPGSAFKPVVYSLALSQKWKWSDVIFVSPITIHNYRPRTPDEDFLTETTLLRAFYRSMNTPTVELGQKLGLAPVLEQARLLGIRSPIKEEFGSMLGSSDVTMFDMARMYGTFANAGKLVETVGITRITDRFGKVLYEAPPATAREKQVITPQIAYLMTQGMRSVLAMGTGFASARLANVAAGKTGTSNDATDNWFCGYSPDLVTIVWVGTDEHAQIYGDAAGGKLALPIWDRFVSKVLETKKPEPFLAPPGIVTTVVHPKFGNRSPAGVRMFFLRGNEPPDDGSALEVLSQSGDGGYRDLFTH